MTTRMLGSLKAIARRLTVLLVSVMVLLNITQTAVFAASPSSETVGIPGVTKSISDEDDTTAKEERREWQSKVSNIDAKSKEPETLGEKLNVDELQQGFDPEREAEKRSEPTP